MPPKVTDTHSTNAESLHAVGAETAEAARRIVATYSVDFFDCATLACMLGVAPEGLNYRKLAAEHAEANPPKKTTKRTQKATKKATKKTTKATKKTTKKATKKTTKKTTRKTTTKAAAKKTTKKTTRKA